MMLRVALLAILVKRCWSIMAKKILIGMNEATTKLTSADFIQSKIFNYIVANLFVSIMQIN